MLVAAKNCIDNDIPFELAIGTNNVNSNICAKANQSFYDRATTYESWEDFDETIKEITLMKGEN